MKIVAVEDDAIYYETESHDSVSSDYFLDHWGSCSMEKCACLDPKNGPWLGRLCPSWTPAMFTTHEEHLRWFMARSAP